MSNALQAAVFAACLAFVVLAVYLIPIVFQARRRLEQLTISANALSSQVGLLADESRELIRNVGDLVTRTNQRLDDVDQVVQMVEGWAGRADRLVSEVGSAIEPPVFTAVHSANLFRAGMNGFMQVLLHRNHAKLEE